MQFLCKNPRQRKTQRKERRRRRLLLSAAIKAANGGPLAHFRGALPVHLLTSELLLLVFAAAPFGRTHRRNGRDGAKEHLGGDLDTARLSAASGGGSLLGGGGG
jgi:hypothetical protein